MEHEGTIIIKGAIESSPFIWNIAVAIFVGGIILLSLYIRKFNSFTAKDALLATAGLKKFKRNWIINIINILVVIVPLLLMYYVLTSYVALKT